MALGVQLSFLVFMNDEQQFDTNGAYVAFSEGVGGTGTIYIWDLPSGTRRSYNYLNTAHANGPSSGGEVHITEYNEVMLRTGGSFLGSAPTYYEFRSAVDFSQTQTPINLDTYVIPIAPANNLNFGFIAAEYNGFIVSKVGPEIYENEPWIILQRVSSVWTVIANHAGATGRGDSLQALSMGPTYAYARVEFTQTLVRVRWNGTWAETDIDLSGDLGGRNIYEIGYFEPTNEVIVMASDGGTAHLFVYNEDVTVLNRSGSVATGTPPFNSKRMVWDATSIGVFDSNAALIKKVLVSDLSVERSLNATTLYVDGNQPPAYFMIAPDADGFVKGGNVFPSDYWPDIAPITAAVTADGGVPVGVEVDAEATTPPADVCPIPGVSSEQCIIGQTSIPPGTGQILCGAEQAVARDCD